MIFLNYYEMIFIGGQVMTSFTSRVSQISEEPVTDLPLLPLHVGEMPPDRGNSLVLANEGFRDAVRDGMLSSKVHPTEEKVAAAARKVVEDIFCCITSSEAAEHIDLPVPELQTTGLDAEQLWSQINLQLEPVLSRIVNVLKNADFSKVFERTSGHGFSKDLNVGPNRNIISRRAAAETGKQPHGDPPGIENNAAWTSETTRFTEGSVTVQHESSRLEEAVWHFATRQHQSTKEVSNAPKLSAFQRAQQILSKRVETLEEQSLQEKKWQLRGEAYGRERPKNSVLCMEMEFDDVRQTPPVISELMTTSLENVIQARVSEQRFDEIERENTFSGPLEISMPPVAEDTKSKVGLGELYAEAFQNARLQQNAGGGDGVDDEVALGNEAKKMLSVLLSKLDALSHSQLSPKLVVDATSFTEVPALKVEQAGSVEVSEAARRMSRMRMRSSCIKSRSRAHSAAGYKANDELTKQDKRHVRAMHKRKKKSSITQTGLTPSKSPHVAAKQLKDAEQFALSHHSLKGLSKNTRLGSIIPGYAKSSQVFSRIQSEKDGSNGVEFLSRTTASRSSELKKLKL